MHTKNRIATLMCLTGLLASGAALAEDKGAYLGFSAGQTRANFDGSPAIAAGFPVTYDNSAGVWKAYGGYQFNQYFGAELTYVKLGDYNANVTVPGFAPLFTQIRINGWGGALVGTLPLGKGFSLLGKIGETYTRESRGDCNICIAPVTNSSSNIWSPTFGAGLKYAFTPNLSARAEVERFTKVGDSNNGTIGASIMLYTAGLAYKF
jgi:OOP family OmpA-OmpF porin